MTRGRTVLAMDCALADAQMHHGRPLNRYVSSQRESVPEIYMLFSRDDYAGYLGVSQSDTDAVLLKEPPSDPSSWATPHLVEYLGDPPTKPKKRGRYHQAANAHFFSEEAISLLSPILEQKGTWLPVQIAGRDEKFYRYWITHTVDCLDLRRSKLSGVKPTPTNIGVIRKPAFRYDAWDGSDVFRIPGDPNVKFFVSERFVQRCIELKIKGAQFVREYFDVNPIRV